MAIKRKAAGAEDNANAKATEKDVPDTAKGEKQCTALGFCSSARSKQCV